MILLLAYRLVYILREMLSRPHAIRVSRWLSVQLGSARWHTVLDLHKFSADIQRVRVCVRERERERERELEWVWAVILSIYANQWILRSTIKASACWVFDWLIYVRASTMTAIWTVGQRLRSTLTYGHRFTALGLLWRSPIHILTMITTTNRAWNLCDVIITWSIYSRLGVLRVVNGLGWPVSRRIKLPPPKNGDSPNVSRKWNLAIGDRRRRKQLRRLTKFVGCASSTTG